MSLAKIHNFCIGGININDSRSLVRIEEVLTQDIANIQNNGGGLVQLLLIR